MSKNGLHPWAPEFTGVTPLCDSPNLDIALAAKIDLLSTGKSFELARLAVGQLCRLDFTESHWLTFSLRRPSQELASEPAQIHESTFDWLSPGDDALVLGASLGGSALKVGQLVQYCRVQANKSVTYYLTPEEIKAMGASREAILETRGFFEDEKGLGVNACKWLFGRETPDLLQVSVEDTKSRSFLTQF